MGYGCALCPGFIREFYSILQNTDCLQLCEGNASSSYGAAQCSNRSGGCQGSSNANCYPYSVWSRSEVETGYYHTRQLGNGTFDVTFSRVPTYAFSVRCVTGFGKNTDGLQLCDWSASSSTGAAQCYWSGGCQGSTVGDSSRTNMCFPHAIWSGSKLSSVYYHFAFGLEGGSFYNPFGSSGHISTFSLSVRCVPGFGLSADGLQLCDSEASSLYGASRCSWEGSICRGAFSNNCNPFDLWAKSAYAGQLQFGDYRATSTNIVTYAFSVRCLLLALYGHRVRLHPYHPRLRCAACSSPYTGTGFGVLCRWI